MSLKYYFKKAVSSVFSVKKSFLANAALAVAIVGGGAYTVQHEMQPAPSAVHMVDLGGQQLQRLQQDVKTIGDLKGSVQSDARGIEDAQQKLIVTPNDKQLESRIDGLRAHETKTLDDYNSTVENFRTHILLGKGISEKEAMTLATQFQQVTGEPLLKTRDGDNLAGTLRYRDEAQAEVMQNAPTLDSGTATNVMNKMNDKTDDNDFGRVFLFLGSLVGLGFGYGALVEKSGKWKREVEYEGRTRARDKQRKKEETARVAKTGEETLQLKLSVAKPG